MTSSPTASITMKPLDCPRVVMNPNPKYSNQPFTPPAYDACSNPCSRQLSRLCRLDRDGATMASLLSHGHVVRINAKSSIPDIMHTADGFYATMEFRARFTYRVHKISACEETEAAVLKEIMVQAVQVLSRYSLELEFGKTDSRNMMVAATDDFARKWDSYYDTKLNDIAEDDHTSKPDHQDDVRTIFESMNPNTVLSPVGSTVDWSDTSNNTDTDSVLSAGTSILDSPILINHPESTTSSSSICWYPDLEGLVI